MLQEVVADVTNIEPKFLDRDTEFIAVKGLVELLRRAILKERNKLSPVSKPYRLIYYFRRG